MTFRVFSKGPSVQGRDGARPQLHGLRFLGRVSSFRSWVQPCDRQIALCLRVCFEEAASSRITVLGDPPSWVALSGWVGLLGPCPGPAHPDTEPMRTSGLRVGSRPVSVSDSSPGVRDASGPPPPVSAQRPLCRVSSRRPRVEFVLNRVFWKRSPPGARPAGAPHAPASLLLSVTLAVDVTQCNV